MIHYQLLCACGRGFDGWFPSSAGFEDQASRGLVACPACGGNQVARGLMSPGIASRADPPRVTKPPAAPRPQLAGAQSKLPVAGGPIPDGVRAALHQLRAEVEKSCDYVGRDFAAEARRIHNGEAEPRGIYGESTEAQAEALADDGIEIARIPWIRTDS